VLTPEKKYLLERHADVMTPYLTIVDSIISVRHDQPPSPLTPPHVFGLIRGQEVVYYIACRQLHTGNQDEEFVQTKTTTIPFVLNDDWSMANANWLPVINSHIPTRRDMQLY
jgi:hypothetical protein